MTVLPAGNHEPVQVQKNATLGEAVKKMQAGSWAAVAATEIPSGNGLVKFRPRDALKRHMAANENAAMDPSAMRVVWLKPWDRRPLSCLTESIDQGPLLSMAYSPDDNAVCIIFMHAHHARGFMEVNADFFKRHGRSSFGSDIEVLQGQPYPLDESLKRMENPWNERRRLTFARQKLFAEGLTEDQFKRDIYEIVGEQNVELVWLFNTGNGESPSVSLAGYSPFLLQPLHLEKRASIADSSLIATVVFAATSLARIVKDEYRKRARQAGPYRDVQVSFSHDPCERPMNLITQMPSSRNTVRPLATTNGANFSHNFPRPSGLISPRRQQSLSLVDEDGWQTVARRK